MSGYDPTQFIGLSAYFEKCFLPFNNLAIPLKPLHFGTCDILQRAFLGELKKSFILINIPPRIGKTKMCESFITWALAYFPDSQFIYTSYSNDRAKESVRYIQEVMARQWYLDLFSTRLGNIQQADHFDTTLGGMVYGDGVGGSLTGVGAGLKRRAGGAIVIDDAAKPEQAMSRVESDKLRFWFENTLKSRRNSSQWTPIIVCMQRLDAEDLTGFLLENYPNDCELIKFSGFVNGQSVIPETTDTKSMLDSQRVNPYTFAAQICQEPIVLGGNLIKIANFRYYEPGETPRFELKVITCDTALKAKTSNNHSVLQCWGRAKHQAFLVDQIRGHWTPDQLLKNSAAFYRKHSTPTSPVASLVVEEAAAGVTLISDMRKRGIPARGVIRTKDKVTRVNEILAYQETGMVWLPKSALWLPAFELELAQFRADGKSIHDDQVDAFADGVLMTLGKGTSILSVIGKPKKAA